MIDSFHCLDCDCRWESNYNYPKKCPKCGSEEFEEWYNLKCMECGEHFVGAENDECPECGGLETYEED